MVVLGIIVVYTFNMRVNPNVVVMPNGTTTTYPRYYLPNQVTVIITRATTTITTTTTVYRDTAYITVPGGYEIITVPVPSYSFIYITVPGGGSGGGVYFPEYVEISAVRPLYFSFGPNSYRMYERTDVCLGSAVRGTGFISSPYTTYTTTVTTTLTTVITYTDDYNPDIYEETTVVITTTYTTTRTLYTYTFVPTKTYYFCSLPTWTLVPPTRILTVTETQSTIVVSTTVVPTGTITLPNITVRGTFLLGGMVYFESEFTRTCGLTTWFNQRVYDCERITFTLWNLTMIFPLARIYITPVVVNNPLTPVDWVRNTTILTETVVCGLTQSGWRLITTCYRTPEYTVAYPVGYEGVYLSPYLISSSIVSYVLQVNHYAPPDFSLDPNMFVTRARLHCQVQQGQWFPASITLVRYDPIYTRPEYDPPRLLYIEVRYTGVYTHNMAIPRTAEYVCYVEYVNPYPRLTLTYYFHKIGYN